MPKQYLKTLRAAVILGFILIIAVAIKLWQMQRALFVDNPTGEAVELRVDEGLSVAQIGILLKENEIISDSILFQLYNSFTGSGSKLNAGLYAFSKGQSIATVTGMMARGEVVRNIYKFVIPEGSNIKQIAASYERQGFYKAEEFLQAIERSRLRRARVGVIYPLEGYLFPATYTFDELPTPDELIDVFYSTALDRFGDLKIPAECPLSFDEVIILASIIEKESQHDGEREIVAGVFLNRLEIGMPLQSCATVQYILPEVKAILTEADTLTESPYNTYIYDGLPIGPISNPSLEAINAVLYPEETEYLFFVAGADGRHIFTHSYEEHLAAIAKLGD